MDKLFFVSITANQLKKSAEVEYIISLLTVSITGMLFTTS